MKEEIMLKNTSQLTCVIEDKIYQFICDQDSPIEKVKEAMFEFIKFVGNIEDNHKAQIAAAEAQKEAAEEAEVEALVESILEQ